MATRISRLSEVDPRAELADGVEIGPFCVVGPDVKIGAGTKLDSHVVLIGNTVVGERNRFCANTVIGGEPQDKSYKESDTLVLIGDENMFREGVTVNRGAEKEDGVTRIGNNNLLMSNAHVAHNCHIFNHTILVNGVLLGGHVHVQDRAIISGNSAVHHFSTIGTLAFISGGCRVPHDVPPYMLHAGSDNPEVKTINLVGMKRAGLSESAIDAIKRCHRLIFREHKKIDAARDLLHQELDGVFPFELSNLLTFLEAQQRGKMGRAREAVRALKGAEVAAAERAAAERAAVEREASKEETRSETAQRRAA
jgi:UDP-N-acetylglucosamine acyltransferase